MSGCICDLNTVILFFLWCYTWVDVIYIWDIVLVLFVVMYLLSSLEEIDICVELHKDDVCEAEYYKTGSFSAGVDNFDQWFL